jgi:hypothetical protein
MEHLGASTVSDVEISFFVLFLPQHRKDDLACFFCEWFWSDGSSCFWYVTSRVCRHLVGPDLIAARSGVCSETNSSSRHLHCVSLLRPGDHSYLLTPSDHVRVLGRLPENPETSFCPPLADGSDRSGHHIARTVSREERTPLRHL